VQENLDAFKRMGSKLPFEGTGIRVQENQNLVPPEQRERNPEVLAMIEKKAKKAKKVKASVAKPSVAKAKPKKNGIVKKATKAVKKVVKKATKKKSKNAKP